MAELLINNGANVSHSNDFGQTVLHMAASFGSINEWVQLKNSFPKLYFRNKMQLQSCCSLTTKRYLSPFCSKPQKKNYVVFCVSNLICVIRVKKICVIVLCSYMKSCFWNVHGAFLLLWYDGLFGAFNENKNEGFYTTQLVLD